MGFGVSLLVWAVAWQGMIPAPGMIYFGVTSIYGTVYFLPYIAHRLLSHRLAGFATTLVFPTAWVSADLLFQRFISPYGSWTSLAYTQVDFLSLMQLASLTGTFGITFLITWFASIIAWLWRVGLGGNRLRTAMLAFGLPFVAAVVLGSLRLSQTAPLAESVRVTTLTPSRALLSELEAAFQGALIGEPFSRQQMAELRLAAKRLNDDLLGRSREAVAGGAQLVAWSETAGRVTVIDEPALIEAGEQLVAENGVVMAMAYGTWAPDRFPPLENKLVMISPGSPEPRHYRKSHPIIGAESPLVGEGDKTIPLVETPHGLLSGVICHDLDFPELLRQGGRQKVRLMLGPSADWSEIADMHAAMATVRAVENGFVLIRPTSGGRTVVVDSRGREVASSRNGNTLTAEVSQASVSTPYSRVGDLFGWLSLGTLAALAASAVRRKEV